MSLPFLNVLPIDPGLKTGPARLMSGPVRMSSLTTDVGYGEFATWLYVGVSGDVNITQWDGTDITMQNFAQGIWQPVYSVRVNASGTTATGILWGS